MTESQTESSNDRLVFGSLAGRTLVEVRGADRITFLHNLCTNDVKALTDGRGCEAFFTNVQGKIVCHGLLFAAEESIWISTAPGLSDTLIPHLDKYLIREDVQLIDRSSEFVTTLLAGETAEQLVKTNFDHTLELLQHATLPDHDGRIASVPFADPAAYFLFSPVERVEGLEVVLAGGGATRASVEELELLRIQAKFPCSGRDVTIDNLPQEVGRDGQAISFTKGCYLGQETVARIDAMGRVNQHLVSLQFTGKKVPPPATILTYDSKTVGRVTSSCWSPLENRVIALGYVRREFLEQDSELSSDFGSVRVKA